VRAILDPNVIISGLLSPSGAPADVLRALDRGEFELIVSPALLDELARALAYPKLRRHIGDEDANAVVRWISDSATIESDPNQPPPVRSADSGDDYLIALAASQRAVLVSGDRHLIDLVDQIPVFSPREFLELLAKR
jgi:uncharacterized protein